MRKLFVLAAFAAGALLVALLALACGRGAVDSVIDASVTLLPARPPEPNLGSSYPTCQNTTALGGVPWVVGGHQQTVCAQPDAGLVVLVALADGGWEWLPYAGGGGSASFADGSGIPLVVDGASAGNLACTNGQLVMADGGAGYWVCGPTAAQVFTAGGDLSGSATSQTVDGLQGRTLSANAPVECNNLQWDGGSWGPSSVNLAGGAGCIQGTLGIGNGGTGLTSASSAGEYPRSNGSALVMSVIPSADLTNALLTCPVIDGTAISIDGGFTTGAGSLGPIYDTAHYQAALTPSTWTNMDCYAAGAWNQYVLIDDLCVFGDFSGFSGVAVTGNHQDCYFRGDVTVYIDGGTSTTTPSSTTVLGTQALTCMPFGTSGCTGAGNPGDAGCSAGTTSNPAWSFQLTPASGGGCAPFFDAGSCLCLQAAVDAGSWQGTCRNDRMHLQ